MFMYCLKEKKGYLVEDMFYANLMPAKKPRKVA